MLQPAPLPCIQCRCPHRYLSQLGCHSHIAAVLVWSVQESLQDAIDPLLDSAAALLFVSTPNSSTLFQFDFNGAK